MSLHRVAVGIAAAWWAFNVGQVFAAGSDPGAVAQQSYAMGTDRLAQGNFLGAAFMFERVLTVDPRHVDAHRQLGLAYTEMGRQYRDYLAKAEQVYVKLRDIVGEDDVQYRKGLAKLKLAQWKVDEAVLIYEEMVASEPENCEMWTLLAEGERLKSITMEEGSAAQLDVARGSYEKAIELCPDYMPAYYGLAKIFDQRKQTQEVVKLYSKLMKQYPGKVEALRGFAIAIFNTRDWKTAAQAFGELLEKDPRPEERLVYISALRKLNRMEEAEKQVKIYLETAPKPYGPQQLLPIDVLREELGILPASEKAATFLEQGRYDEAIAIWKEAKGRVESKLHVEERQVREAAERLVVWLDRRIVYAEELKRKKGS